MSKLTECHPAPVTAFGGIPQIAVDAGSRRER